MESAGDVRTGYQVEQRFVVAEAPGAEPSPRSLFRSIDATSATVRNQASWSRVERGVIARVAVAVAVGLMTLAACGEGGVSTEPAGQRGSNLTVTARASRTAAPTSWSLTCDPAGGTHPDPASACRALAAADHPFAETPRQQACTEIYGGDQLAEISGTWRGKAVRASYSRANGCEIGRWDAIAAVFPIRVGVEFPRAS